MSGPKRTLRSGKSLRNAPEILAILRMKSRLCSVNGSSMISVRMF